MPSYQAELDMFSGIMSQFNIRSIISPLGALDSLRNDFGPRRALGPGAAMPVAIRVAATLRENTVYHVSDEFQCHYALLLLPEYREATVLLIGPYMDSQPDIRWVENFAAERDIHSQWIPILESYYMDVPCIGSGKIVSAALNSLGERIWGIHRFTSENIVSGLPESCLPLTMAPEPQLQEDIIQTIKKIEARYEAENKFVQAVSQGLSHRASIMLSNFTKGALENRTEPIRNIKNYSVIMNTLMRKAAEQGGVHPLHIDRLSSEFARKIETSSRIDDFMELWQEMSKKYCLLVKNHSTREYSQLVQHVIARIDFDLTADLSLKASAAALNVNASYLSTLFKKETGLTLTDYVNRKRVEHAVYLLNATDMPISAVGQSCGIADDNYFTKIFKKYTSLTPKQYRLQSSRLKNLPE